MAQLIVRGLAGVGLVLLTLILVFTGFVFLQGARTPKGNPEYVALGSSFAAGAGLGKLEPGSPFLCARSMNGYPQQLARMLGLHIVDMSCGGAVTKNVLKGGQYFQGAQIRTIDARTRLVTITSGGNDIGYIGDLGLLSMRRSQGLFGWMARTLWKGPKPVAVRDFAGVERDIAATIRVIHQRAPKATVVVATYPTILPASGTCPMLRLSADEAALMRQVGDQLATTTRAAATESGAIFVDMNTLGSDHNACSASPWTRASTNGGVAPFHPTLAGAKATADAVLRAIGA